MYFVVIDKDLGSVEANTTFMDAMLEQTARIVSPDLDMFINEQPHLTGVRIVQTSLGNIINVDPELGLTITCMWYDVPGFEGTYVAFSDEHFCKLNNEFSKKLLLNALEFELDAGDGPYVTHIGIARVTLADVIQITDVSFLEAPFLLLESPHNGQLEYLRDQAILQLDAMANGVANEE